MAIGTGIFLGLLCVAAAFLYTQTKDRWRWRTIVRWPLRVVVALALIGALLFGFVLLQERLESRPRLVTRYADIGLGDSKDEVLYAKGPPNYVLESDAIPTRFLRVTRVSDIPAGKSPADYLYWSYESERNGRLDIKFSARSNLVVSVFCFSKPDNRCPELNGVFPEMTEDQVLHRLGKPARADIEKSSGYVKTLKYPQYQVAFYLTKRQVYALELGDRDETDAGKKPAQK